MPVSKHKSTIKYGINTIAFKGLQIWQNIPLEIGNSVSLGLCKSNNKKKKYRAYLIAAKFVVHS